VPARAHAKLKKYPEMLKQRTKIAYNSMGERVRVVRQIVPPLCTFFISPLTINGRDMS